VEKKIYPKDLQRWKTYERAAGGKQENQNKLFADWDILNVLNLTPPCMLVFLLVPTVMAWLVTVCLQGSFIYYIAQEVSSLKWPEGEAEASVCFGASEGDMGSLKMTKNFGLRLLRLICNLTFGKLFLCSFDGKSSTRNSSSHLKML